MNTKAIISALILCISLFFVSNAQARPELTPEQLAKAREVAQQMRPPINFDALLDEADRLDVECEGDLTRRAIIKMCKLDVENAKLNEEYEAKRKELKTILDETKEIANEKLSQ